MGCFVDGPKDQGLTLATLNYSGIQDSPYEFYETQNEAELKLNQIFSEVCSKYLKEFQEKSFKWKISRFDKEWHTRYSPLYLKVCGVKKDNKMMNEKEFEAEWDKVFDQEFSKYQSKIYGKITKQQKEKSLPFQKLECRLFDKCVYETIIKYIYGVDQIKNLSVSAGPYLQYQQLRFNKAFLNSDLKFMKTKHAIQQNSIDVLFIQEGNEQLLKQLEQINKNFYLREQLSKGITSMILLKKNKFSYVKNFQQENQRFLEQYQKRTKGNALKDLNWNQDTIFQVLGRTIYISGHLSSKKEKNPLQIKQMILSLQKLKKNFPEYQFVIGADVNGDLDKGFLIQNSDGKKQKISVFPDKDNDITVYKKRTLMQPQKHKANELNAAAKDYLVTSLQFITHRIVTINNIFIEKGKSMLLLPNAEHPYDHYLVAGKINIL